jgi:putative ABC transport system ATP-binding protein
VKGRGAAMLLVTHSPAAAARADRQLMLTREGLIDG